MDLSIAERAIFSAITNGDKAWSNLESLVQAGHDVTIIEGLMADSDPARNPLVRWHHPDDGESVTLTPWGACVWAQASAESLELAERPATVNRGPRKSRLPLTEKQKQLAEEMKRVTNRVPYWIEGSRDAQPRDRRKRLKEFRPPMPELVRAREPEFMVDEATDEMVELFTRLFDGTKVQGIKVKIDPKLKGAKKAKAKRRRAG